MTHHEIVGSSIKIYIEDETDIDWGLAEVLEMLERSLPSLENFVYSEHTILDKSSSPEIVLDLRFCSDEEMIEINTEHRGKEKTTDVLSFPLADNLRSGSDEFIIPGELSLGDIIISREVAARQATEFSITIAEEVIHLLVHGVLHLLGFDHEISEEEETIMEAHEKSVLAEIANNK